MGRRFESGLRHHPHSVNTSSVFVRHYSGVRRFSLILLLITLCLSAWAQQTPYRERPLAVGDRVEVAVLGGGRSPETLSIRQDGKLSLRSLGLIAASGQSVQGLQEAIQKALHAKGETGEALVRRVVSKDQPISFAGAFRKAGSIQPWKDAALGELLRAAEPTQRADLENVEVWSIDGKLTYVDATQSAGESTKLLPGDAVFVPELKAVPQITILGAVAKPGVIPYTRGMTAKQAIEAAGGMSNRADSTKVRIERNGKAFDTINLDLNYDTTLKAGDVVSVQAKPEQQFVTISGAIKKEGLVDFKEGMSLSDAIKNAGGLLPLADIAKISIMRRVNGALQRQTVDLSKVRAGKQPDVLLQANDLIDVPVKKASGPATLPPTGGGGSFQEARR